MDYWYVDDQIEECFSDEWPSTRMSNVGIRNQADALLAVCVDRQDAKGVARLMSKAPELAAAIRRILTEDDSGQAADYAARILQEATGEVLP